MKRSGKIKAGLMIGRIGLELGPQRIHRPGLFGLAGKGQSRASRLDLSAGGNLCRSTIQDRLGLLNVFHRQIGTHQPTMGRRIGRIFLKDCRESLGSIGGRPFFKHLLGSFDCRAQILVLTRRTIAHTSDLGDELIDLTRRQRALKAVHRLPLPKGINGRDRLHAQLARIGLVPVNIDLDHLDRTLGLGHRRLERGAKRPAWATPRRPEIDDDRNRL